MIEGVYDFLPFLTILLTVYVSGSGLCISAFFTSGSFNMIFTGLLLETVLGI